MVLRGGIFLSQERLLVAVVVIVAVVGELLGWWGPVDGTPVR